MMTYKVLNQMISGLQESGEIHFQFNDKEYVLCCYYMLDDDKSLSVRDKDIFGRSMNVDKITSQYITLYDYNLMGQRSQFKLPISQITLV